MNVKQLSLADYSLLEDIPIVNQDLSATGFTPTPNNYYRHTGTTTDNFTQGLIYLYDTGYHKLGGSQVLTITINGTTYSPDANGNVDLGTVGGSSTV